MHVIVTETMITKVSNQALSVCLYTLISLLLPPLLIYRILTTNTMKIPTLHHCKNREIIYKLNLLVPSIKRLAMIHFGSWVVQPAEGMHPKYSSSGWWWRPPLWSLKQHSILLNIIIKYCLFFSLCTISGIVKVKVTGNRRLIKFGG